ncbi:hypothetical protein U1839_02065 [Sphingomonas sp. RT2P30]
MRLRSVTAWLAATARGRRAVPAGAEPTPSSETPPDRERVAAVGEVLQACFPDPEEPLDDHLTALMLRLSIDPTEPTPKRRKR